MVKVVENNERICTVNLDGSECSIVFQSHYKYFTVKNESDSKVYISLKRDIVPEADGVMTVNSKESATITNMQPNVNMFFAIGSGKIQVFASNSDNFINPFKLAPVAGSGGGLNNAKWELSDPYNFCTNTKNTTNSNGSGYDFNNVIPNTFGMYQSYSSYNLTHSIIVDFTNVKKVIINGATRANTSGLSATGYCCISGETLSEISDDWIVLNQSVGADISEFSAEIDCNMITGEQYIYLAILHGTESSGNTSYLFIYDIEFIYR